MRSFDLFQSFVEAEFVNESDSRAEVQDKLWQDEMWVWSFATMWLGTARQRTICDSTAQCQYLLFNYRAGKMSPCKPVKQLEKIAKVDHIIATSLLAVHFMRFNSEKSNQN